MIEPSVIGSEFERAIESKHRGTRMAAWFVLAAACILAVLVLR